jgi:transcriptional regulator with XRE-family HTH domain
MGGGKGGPGTRLGELVWEWRRAAGLTQRELAARSGLSLAAVRDLEQGRSHRPREGSLARLAGALGLDAGQAAVLAAAAGQFFSWSPPGSSRSSPVSSVTCAS